ncbi:MAG: hypothetical protein VX278_19980 [Myxococcota bacterium]|nr:hypothetical protein [Myxococcota bacterium]
MLWCLISQIWAWAPMGPERGHVLDSSVVGERVYVTTRVGVMYASLAMDDWERDSRFPPDTKVIGAWKDGVWAAPPGQLWEVGKRPMRLLRAFQESLVVDIAAQEQGTAVVAVRGKEKGIWVANKGGSLVRRVPDVDAWVTLADGDAFWVGTTDAGLWYSADAGETFQKWAEGGVTALERVGTSIWAALPDGRILDVTQQKTMAQISNGYASSMAELGNQKIFLTVSSPNLGASPFQVFQKGKLSTVSSTKVDKDKSHLSPTQSWSLRNGDALVGSFRRGPLRWNGKLRLSSENFYATVSGGAAIDASGQLVLALMGTGVYIWKDGAFGPHLPKGPLTDSVAVKRVGDKVVVIDFDGVRILSEDGSWLSMKGVFDPRDRNKNILVDIGKTNDEDWWAIDSYGRLYKSVDGKWANCTTSGALRIDGDGDSLNIATRQGYVKPHCHKWLPIHESVKNVMTSRSYGPWVATAKTLYYNGESVAQLSGQEIQALLPDGDGILVAQRKTSIQRCSPQCVDIAPPISEDILSMGYLPDDRLWVLEKRGTLLVNDGQSYAPPNWHQFTDKRMSYGRYIELYKNPWMFPPIPQSKPFAYLVSSSRGWVWFFVLPFLLLFSYFVAKKT